MVQHADITGSAFIHEEKRISSASPSDAGKVVTPSSSSAGVGELRRLNENELMAVKDYYTAFLPDLSTTDSAWSMAGRSGTIKRVDVILHDTIDADTNVTIITPAGVVGNISLIASGSSAGSTFSLSGLSSAVTSLDTLQAQSNGTTTSSVPASVMFSVEVNP